jgi:hypothetical protein
VVRPDASNAPPLPAMLVKLVNATGGELFKRTATWSPCLQKVTSSPGSRPSLSRMSLGLSARGVERYRSPAVGAARRCPSTSLGSGAYNGATSGASMGRTPTVASNALVSTTALSNFMLSGPRLDVLGGTPASTGPGVRLAARDPHTGLWRLSGARLRNRQPHHLLTFTQSASQRSFRRGSSAEVAPRPG